MIDLVLATRNAHKQREIQEVLAEHGVHVRTLNDFPEFPETIEDEETFAGNAEKKAVEAAQATGQWAMADDSGLCVDALKGAPGIFSARYAGEPRSDERNNAKLIAELEDVPDSKRTAHYVSHIAVADSTGRIVLSEGAICSGRITRHAAGAGGFGYDPYFQLLEYHRTFGELSPIVKKYLGHRGRALARILPMLIAELKKS